MNKEQLNGMWDQFRVINGITMRAIQAIPKDKIEHHPVRDMRTPKELIAHMYETMKSVTDGVATGTITTDEGAASGAGIKTHEDLVRYASECWKASNKTIQSLNDAKLASTVKTPWGTDFPGHVCVNIIYQEHLHHRGQLYAYLRQMGIEPPFMWDFENNAPEFQQKAAQSA